MSHILKGFPKGEDIVGYSIKKSSGQIGFIGIKSDFWVVFGLFSIFFEKKIGFNPNYLDYFLLDSTGTGGIFWVIFGLFWIFLVFFWVILDFLGFYRIFF
jgi:hypothetical protein